MTAEVILPLAERNGLNWWHEKFGTHVLRGWSWHL